MSVCKEIYFILNPVINRNGLPVRFRDLMKKYLS